MTFQPEAIGSPNPRQYDQEFVTVVQEIAAGVSSADTATITNLGNLSTNYFNQAPPALPLPFSHVVMDSGGIALGNGTLGGKAGFWNVGFALLINSEFGKLTDGLSWYAQLQRYSAVGNLVETRDIFGSYVGDLGSGGFLATAFITATAPFQLLDGESVGLVPFYGNSGAHTIHPFVPASNANDLQSYLTATKVG